MRIDIGGPLTVHEVKVGKSQLFPGKWLWLCWTCGARSSGVYENEEAAKQDATVHQNA